MIYETLVWTKRGWLTANELVIGDVVISYNPSRACTEYDIVSYIKTDYKTNAIMGLKSHSMNLALTPDHPFIVKNNINKSLTIKPINELFLDAFNENKTVLYCAPFEPYLVSHDLEDIAWTARVASSFGNVRYMPIEYFNEIWNIVNELGAIEAQHWIDVFFHWGVLEGGTYWSKATKLSNRQARDMVYHIAPRAGFGARFMPNPKKVGQWIIGLSTQNAPQIRKTHWYRDRVEGQFFNIKTNNGSFLGRKTGGTFLCPCDVT